MQKMNSVILLQSCSFVSSLILVLFCAYYTKEVEKKIQLRFLSDNVTILVSSETGLLTQGCLIVAEWWVCVWDWAGTSCRLHGAAAVSEAEPGHAPELSQVLFHTTWHHAEGCSTVGSPPGVAASQGLWASVNGGESSRCWQAGLVVLVLCVSG